MHVFGINFDLIADTNSGQNESVNSYIRREFSNDFSILPLAFDILQSNCQRFSTVVYWTAALDEIPV